MIPRLRARLRPTALRRKALRITASWLLLVSILACGGSRTHDDDEPGAQERSEAMRSLEAHLDNGATFGEGAGAQDLANAVRATLAPGDGVAARVIAGDPQNLVVLVRYRPDSGYEDLRDIAPAERNAEIDRIVRAIDRRYEATHANLAVAIRGAVFYGAVGVRMAGQPMQYHTGSVVSLAPLDPLLTATPGVDVPLPTIAMGELIEGTVIGPPEAPAGWTFDLLEETVVVTQLTNRAMDAGPFVGVCTGIRRSAACEFDDSLEPLPDFDSERLDALIDAADEAGEEFHYYAYRLPPGSYTTVIIPDCNRELPCASAGVPFRFQITAER